MSSKFIVLILILCLLQSVKSKLLIDDEDNVRVVDGKRAHPKQFPYVVFIDNYPIITSKYKGHFCTGAILTASWVITGSHCYKDYIVFNVSMNYVRTKVRAGLIDLKKDVKGCRPQTRIAERHVFVKKAYIPGLDILFDNDIVIMQVTKPFIFDGYVGAITIAQHPLPKDSPVSCIFVGFGQKEVFPHGEPLRNDLLHYTEGRLDGDRLSCKRRAWEKYHNTKQYWDDRHLCVDPIVYTSTPCNGDSGGPLVCEGLHTGTSVSRDNVNMSATLLCAQKGNYHIYMFTGYFEKFLRKYIPDLPPSIPLVGEREKYKRQAEETQTKQASGASRLIVALVLMTCVVGHTYSHFLAQRNF